MVAVARIVAQPVFHVVLLKLLIGVFLRMLIHLRLRGLARPLGGEGLVASAGAFAFHFLVRHGNPVSARHAPGPPFAGPRRARSVDYFASGVPRAAKDGRKAKALPPRT